MGASNSFGAAQWALILLALATPGGAASQAPFASHPPMRPLPEESQRSPASGEAFYVDPSRGSDSADGSLARPWRTLEHGLSRLAPGRTLYLRGGVYYETVTARLTGEPAAPITVRSYPGELAILDGGYREFFEQPADAYNLNDTKTCSKIK